MDEVAPLIDAMLRAENPVENPLETGCTANLRLRQGVGTGSGLRLLW
ncbi:hypothetical protein OG568_08545 [Streptomyces sp. NBC_01450]|nr:hypothetical protein [Streptomyces sp. NBC_01450]